MYSRYELKTFLSLPKNTCTYMNVEDGIWNFLLFLYSCVILAFYSRTNETEFSFISIPDSKKLIQSQCEYFDAMF